MRVYTFVHQTVDNRMDYGIELATFATKNDAVDALAHWKQGEINIAKERGWKITDVEDAFETWEEDNWVENHSCGYIEETEL